MYRYRKCPLLLVQVNTDNTRMSIFYVFRHLIIESHGLSVCFFSFLPQMGILEKQYLINKEQF
jgi:hypothetical protein